jgi:hypothetical protein
LARAAYYSLLNEVEVWALYQLYEPDFSLFRYEVDPGLVIRIHDQPDQLQPTSHTMPLPRSSV